MTLTELRYIVVLAEEQHFGRTAARCHVSQPTLSVAVRKLEDELGAVLFERSKNKVQLTRSGEEIVARARLLLNSVATIKSLAETGKDQLSGSLVLGVIYTVAPYLLPQLIPHVKKQLPQVSLRAEEDSTGHLRRKLRDGLLDVILVSLPFTEPDVVTQELFVEPLVVVMPPSHSLAHKAEIDPEDVQPEDLLLLGPGHCLRDQVLAWHGSRRDVGQPQRGEIIEGNSLETLRYMAAAGLGLAVMPRSAADARICAAQRLVARPLIGGSRRLALAWRASFPRHKAIEVLRKSIQICSGVYWNFTTEPDALEQSLLPVPRW